MGRGIDFAFLDSGTGGIPYMLALKEKQPRARCVYLGDTAHFPYGEKSPDAVTECAAIAIKSIVERWEPRAVVVACNTISVTALDSLRTLFPSLPIVGTVPAIRLAARVSKNRRIGLLATNATVRHPYCKRLIDDFASDCTVFSRGDPALVDFIEQKLFTATAAERKAAVLPAVQYFASHSCDTIILGCTHFTHIARDVAEAAGSSILVIDSREGVSKQALKVVAEANARSSCTSDAQSAGSSMCGESEPADMSFFVTACTEQQRAEYETLCANLHIPFGGVLQ